MSKYELDRDDIFLSAQMSIKSNFEEIVNDILGLFYKKHDPQDIADILKGRYPKSKKELDEFGQICANTIERNSTDNKSCEWLIDDLYDLLKMVYRDVSNARFFKLYNADYEETEIECIKKLYEGVREFRNNFDMKSKIPNCRQNCDRCIVNTRNGCKFKNYPERYHKWVGW